MGPCHRNPLPCKIKSFMVLGAGGPTLRVGARGLIRRLFFHEKVNPVKADVAATPEAIHPHAMLPFALFEGP